MTATTEPTNPTESATEPVSAGLVDAYIDVWNATTEQREPDAAAVFADECYYCDGAAEATGPSAITAMIEATLAQFPGASIERMSPVDAHHHQGRFDWRLADADGTTIIDGLDVVRVDSNGRLTEVLGFFGTAVPAATAG